jgi:diguanylate cyclase (GGDEF)-like protein/PAS domain S-box-containing protein
MRPHPTDRRSRLLACAYAAFLAVVCVAVLSFGVWREFASRNADLRNAEVELANLAGSLTQQVEDTFDISGTILFGLVNRIETDGLEGEASTKLQAFLKLRKDSLGRVRGLFVYGEDGRWLATSENLDTTGLNNSDRGYFQHHRSSASREVHVGRAVRSRSGGQWIIPVSRRFDRPDGSFGGVVLATIDVAYFSDLYRRMNVGPNGAISLLTGDGIVLARSSEESEHVGRDLSSRPMFDRSRAWKPSGAQRFVSPLDAVMRISAFKFSDRYPVVVVATKAEQDVLAQWQDESRYRLGAMVALVVLIAIVGAYLTRETLDRQKMAAELAAKEADFRLLAEESSDMVMRIDYEGLIQYVSPSCSRILGWSKEQLVGKPCLAGINKDDQSRVDQAVSALRRGVIEEAKVMYRTRRRSSGEIWLETSLRSVRDQSSRIIGVVAVSRDMSDHKDIEDKLSALAMTDGLTGIANRRCFDERLGDEWARAMRENRPLSLMLIDVDHFKAYNDRYGHQMGDDCLRLIGQLLGSVVRRPGDLVCRYGGEEFAVLLPNTNLEGCRVIGDRLRAATEELSIPHEASTVRTHVTLSVGCSVLAPALTHSVARTDLIQAADRALYRAKRNGRDQVVLDTNCLDVSSDLPAHDAPEVAPML